MTKHQKGYFGSLLEIKSPLRNSLLKSNYKKQQKPKRPREYLSKQHNETEYDYLKRIKEFIPS